MLLVDFTPEAEKDAADAAVWYNKRRTGLGHRFMSELDTVVAVIGQKPKQFPIVHHIVRRALLKHFPFAVFFLIEGNRVIILAVQHTFRDPQSWKARDIK